MLAAARATARRAVRFQPRTVSTVAKAAATGGSWAGADSGSAPWRLAALAGGAAVAASAFAGCTDDPEDKFASMKIFSGNANPDLAAHIAEQVGKPLGSVTVGRFPDGEVSVSVHENVRGKDVYIIQPTCPPHVNEYLVELLLLVTTMRRASAEKITVIVPYYGYARQDRKMTSRVPISAADIARLLESVGVDRVVAVDLHCGQIQGFFGPRVPVDNLAAARVGVDYFARKVDLTNPVIVSPDAGGVYRAKVFREGLNAQAGTDAGLAMIVKQRPRAGVVGQMDLVGSVEDCDCIIVDDMIDTAGTLCKAADLLKARGARRVFAFASHGLFNGPAVPRISKSKIEKVVVVNTIPLAANAKTCAKIEQLDVAPLLAGAIKRIHLRESVSAMFDGKKPAIAASAAKTDAAPAERA